MSQNKSLGEDKGKSDSSDKTTTRPGYTYATNLDKQPTQFVRVKLEIEGQVKIVSVCALCHKAFRLCSLDPSVTEAQVASAKYLGLADEVDSGSAGHSGAGNDSNDSSKQLAKHDSKSDSTKDGLDAKASTSDHKDSMSGTDHKDSKSGTDHKDSKSGAATDGQTDEDRKKAEEDEKKKKAEEDEKKKADEEEKKKKADEEEEKKKKKSHSGSHRKGTLPQTSWNTNKPSTEDWQKKKKKDY